jgi:hypothetical protein
LYLLQTNKVVQFQPEDYYSTASANALLKESLNDENLTKKLSAYLLPNVLFNNVRTEDFLNERLGINENVKKISDMIFNEVLLHLTELETNQK